MAIDDNASYELTGYQVKDLASKIRAKADSNSLASVATSGLYSDLTGAPTIPTVYNGTLTIQQNGTTLGTFSANQSSNETINITGGGGASVTTVVLTLDTPSAGDFSTDKTFAQIISADIVQIFEGTYVYSVVGYSDSSQQKTLYISADGTSIYKLDYTSSSATSGTYTKFESQEKLTAGTNITIAADGKTISATDTTYSNFTGATSQQAGVAGLVPAPTTSDPDKFLKGDGTWGTPASGSAVTLFAYDSGGDLFDASSNYATAQDVLTALGNGKVIIGDIIDYPDSAYEIVSSDSDSYFVAVSRYANGSPEFITLHYDSTSPGAPTGAWTRAAYIPQQKLTAGTNISISGNTISATDTTYSDFTGATSSTAGTDGLVPAPASGDQEKVLHGDGTWKDTTAKLVEMSYGESNAWAKFIAAYNAGSIVYCRASSNANPGTGSQTRKAFMAYVNNATNPTNVEFQYVRSQSSKTDSQQCDQVFVYTLTNTSGGTWSVASRNMGPKIVAGTGMSSTFTTGANATITLNAEPDYSASEVDTKVKWIDGKTIYRKTVNTGALPNAASKTVAHSISNLGKIIKIEGYAYRSTDNTYFPLPFTSESNVMSNIRLMADNTNITIATGVDRSTTAESYVTLYYTKSS